MMESFDPAYFPVVARLEPGNFWYEPRARLIVWALGRYFPDASTFLEIGCGTGFFLQRVGEAFPSLRLTATDLFAEALAEAGKRVSRAALVRADARHVPFHDRFDVVAALDVLEHIDDDRGALAEMFRSTRAGGGVIITVPQHPWLWSSTDVHALHRRRYTRRQLLDRVSGVGFQILRVTSLVSLPLPLMVMSRLRGLCRRDTFDAMEELNVGKRLNAALLAVLDFERRLIQRGVAFRAGGSLLVVAGKPAT